MTEILSVAFVIATVAFFKEQFKLQGNQALTCAILVCTIISIAPILAQSVPPLTPYLMAAINVLKLFFAAAGSYDAAKGLLVQT